MRLPPQRWLLALDRTEEYCGFITNEPWHVLTVNKVVVNKPMANAVNGQYRLQYHVQRLKFGQVVAAVQDIPVATAVRSQLVAQVATMQLELLQFAQLGLIQCALAAHGPVTGHIPVMQLKAVDHS
jgi:hypothetical protein